MKAKRVYQIALLALAAVCLVELCIIFNLRQADKLPAPAASTGGGTLSTASSTLPSTASSEGPESEGDSSSIPQTLNFWEPWMQDGNYDVMVYYVVSYEPGDYAVVLSESLDGRLPVELAVDKLRDSSTSGKEVTTEDLRPGARLILIGKSTVVYEPVERFVDIDSATLDDWTPS